MNPNALSLELAKKVEELAKLYASSDPCSIVLFSEAFGPTFIERSLQRDLHALAKVLRKLVVNQCPLYAYLLPHLYVLGRAVEPELAQASIETARELVKAFRSRDEERWRSWLAKAQVLGGELKRFSTSATLSLKHLRGSCEGAEWRELSLILGEVFEDAWRVIEERIREDLELVTLTAVLTFNALSNDLRLKLGMKSYGAERARELLKVVEERAHSSSEIVKASLVALLSVLSELPELPVLSEISETPSTSASIKGLSKGLFLRLKSSLSVERLAEELSEEEGRGREEAGLYEELYGGEAPILSLGEVELALVARTLRLLGVGMSRSGCRQWGNVSKNEEA
jgi:hypothetical protein